MAIVDNQSRETTQGLNMVVPDTNAEAITAPQLGTNL